jgi:hypothetical protein
MTSYLLMADAIWSRRQTPTKVGTPLDFLSSGARLIGGGRPIGANSRSRGLKPPLAMSEFCRGHRIFMVVMIA